MSFTRPVPFAGTEEEKAANHRSHQWGGIDGRCFECDAKPWHEAAFYPCGTTPPRETVTDRGDTCPGCGMSMDSLSHGWGPCL